MNAEGINFSIVDKLLSHSLEIPDAIAFRYLLDSDTDTEELTYQELRVSAGAIANFLRGRTAPGSRVLLFFPPGIAYIKAFYGCLLAGMIAVPLYPPRRNAKSGRIVNIIHSCQATIALTTISELEGGVAAWVDANELTGSVEFHAIDNIHYDVGNTFSHIKFNIESPAFLQYTSGSTGEPKGVIITHKNIIANIQHLLLMAGGTKDDIFVNWLPLFHDLGLITAVLWPVYLGAASTLMAPATFVRKPVRWLKAISDYRGTMCGAPNFAYDLCVRKISEGDLLTIDLSSWRVAYNAAEPVKSETLNNFSAFFSSCGFQKKSFYPGYGMAEATVFITGGDPAIEPLQLAVDKGGIAENKLVLIDNGNAESANTDAVNIVSCGTARAPHNVCIVDPETAKELEEGCVGEIWFSGPSVSPGYWQLGDVTARTFGQAISGGNENIYLRTGDLGAVYKGELFVTGRIKDLIIFNGKNYYPQDIESSATDAHFAMRLGFCAAFSITNNDRDMLVIVAEIERNQFRNISFDVIISAIRKKVSHDWSLYVDLIVLLKPYKIPITSSGKIQRQKTKQMLLNNELDILGQSDVLSGKEIIKPNTPVEKVLHQIWCEYLPSSHICVNDNFYEIGGNSLLAVEIFSEIKKQFPQVDLVLEQQSDFPTIAELAGFITLKMAHFQSKQKPETHERLNRVVTL